MIYKVQVRCYGEQPNFPKKSKAVTCQMAAIVEAEDHDTAIAAGIAHVHAEAPVDVRWKAFDFMSCAPVALPILVKNI